MLNRRYLHSLRLKIALTLLLLLIVTFAVTSYLRYASYERVLMENLELSAEHALGLIEDSLRDVVLAGDLATIEQATAELVKRHDLHSLTVLDSQGRTLVSLGEQGPYDAEPSRQANPWPGPLRTLPASGGGEIVVIGEHVRVYRTYGRILDQVRGASADPDTDVLAVLICDFSMAAVEARLAAYRQSRLLMTVGSMLAILAAADLMMSRVVVRRLGQILHGVTEVGAGNFPTEVPIAYRDEITELAEAFNRMSAGLAQKERLEREVREGAVQLRTQAERLAALNNLSAAVSQSLNLRDVLCTALDEVLRLMDLRGGWILLRNGTDRSLGPMVTRGLPEEVALAQVQCTWNRLVQSEVLELGRPRIFPYTMEYPCPATKHFQHDSEDIAPPRVSEYPCAAAKYLHRAGLTFRACVPLESKDRIVGVMSLVGESGQEAHEISADAAEMLTAVGRQVGVAIENARLYEALAEKEALSRQLLGRLISVQEDERRHIARELHDQTGQSLTSIILSLRLLGECESPEEARAHIQELRDTVGRILEDVRDLALELRPSALDDLGLLPAIRHCFKGYRDKRHLLIDFQALGFGAERLAPELETTLYRIVQEALTNIVRHAKARNVSVLLEQRDGYVKLIVEDDGVGFVVSDVMAAGPNEGNLGLYGMRERAALLGGKFTIESTPGVGSAVYVAIPLMERRSGDGKAAPAGSG